MSKDLKKAVVTKLVSIFEIGFHNKTWSRAEHILSDCYHDETVLLNMIQPVPYVTH